MSQTLTRKDYIMAIITGVVIAGAALAIRYASRRVESKQEVKLLGQS